MEFCKVCENMIYLKLEEDNLAIKYCKNCGFSETCDEYFVMEDSVVSEGDRSYTEQLLRNPYILHDPTLPRVKGKLVCDKCSNDEIITIKYDSVNMKYIYVCTGCNHRWMSQTNSHTPQPDVKLDQEIVEKKPEKKRLSSTRHDIQVISKRAIKQINLLAEKGYVVVDVTLTSPDERFVRFSPSYPAGDIPVPGFDKKTSKTVEGIWQGLKVFEKEGVDESRFRIKHLRSIRRLANDARGKIIGFQYGDKVIDYVDARKKIYIPAYEYKLEKYMTEDIAMLLGLGDKILLLDQEVNGDVENTSKPLSHAHLLKRWLEKKT